MGRRVYEDWPTKQTLNRVQAPNMPFGWSINPYRGCAHGCCFCYARATHAYLGLEADDAFQNHIFVKVNAAEALEAQLRRLVRKYGLPEAARRIGPVAIGTATDPYQPVEAKARQTRECLKVLARYRIPLTVTTRSPLIVRDLDILKEANVKAVHLSINTLDLRVWRNLEPESPSPYKRLEAVRTLSDAGLNAGVFLAPILPRLTDGEGRMEEVLTAAKAAGARFAVASILRLSPDVKTWFFRVLRERYPVLLEDYRRLYRTAYPPAAYADAVIRRAHRIMKRVGVPFYAEALVEGETDHDGSADLAGSVQLTFSL